MRPMILLIGGNGFIGQALARRLASRGHNVTILSRRPPREKIAGVEWKQGDLTEVDGLRTLLHGHDIVVYLATTSTPGSNVHQPAHEARDNLQPLLRLLEAMPTPPAPSLVYLSSGGAIYGNPAYLPVDEKHPLAPMSNHAAGKAAAEQFLGVFARQGHTVTILRPSNIFGPGQPIQTGFGVVRTLLEHLKHDTPMTIWGNGETSRDYLYLDDFLDACEAALGAPVSNTFNLGRGTALPLNELCALAQQVTGRKLHVHYEPERGVDVRAIALDSTKFSAHYGWLPHTTIEEGLRLTWEWLLTQP